MTEDPKRRRSGALVAATLLLGSGFGPIAALSGSNPAGRRPVTLSQGPPAPAATASSDAAGDLAVDAAPVGGVATAADDPLADPTTVAAAGGSTTRPGATAGTATIRAGTVEQRGAAALALISYPWTRTGYSIVFTGPNAGLLGLTDPPSKQITIYVRPTQSTRDIAWVLGHEIGHAVDFTMTTDAERADYRRIRGLDSRPWYPTCSGCSDFASPVGDWAETFAYWLLGDGSFASELAPRPTAAQLTALTPLFTADPEVVTTTTTRPSTTTKPPTTTATPTTAPRSAPKPVPPRSTPSPRPRPTWPTTTTRPTTTTTRPTTTTTRPTTTTTRPTTTTTEPTTTTTGPTTTTTGPTTTTTQPTTTTTRPTTTTTSGSGSTSP